MGLLSTLKFPGIAEALEAYSGEFRIHMLQPLSKGKNHLQSPRQAIALFHLCLNASSDSELITPNAGIPWSLESFSYLRTCLSLCPMTALQGLSLSAP